MSVLHRDFVRDWFPKSAGIPFGVYYNFLSTTYVAPDKTLGQFVEEKMALLQSRGATQNQVVKNLSDIREAMLTHGFERRLIQYLYYSLKAIFGNTSEDWRMRDSNDVADELGAGVFLSTLFKGGEYRTDEERMAALSLKIREVYASLYEFRAYQIRQFYGLDESKVAMALLVHPSIDTEIASGTSTIRKYFDDRSFDFSVYPKGQSATSPGPSADGIEFKVIKKGWGREFFSTLAGDYFQMEGDGFLDGVLSRDALWYVTDAHDQILSGLERKLGKPLEVNFEWIVLEGFDVDGKPNFIPKILQVRWKPLVVPEKPSDGLSASVPNVILEKYRNDPESRFNIQEDESLGWRHRYDRPADFFAKYYDSNRFHSFIPYYFVRMEDKYYLFLGNSHEFGMRWLSSDLEYSGLNFEFIDVGNMMLDADHVGDKFLISKVTVWPSNTWFVRDELAEKGRQDNISPEDFARLLQAITKPGFIGFYPDAMVRSSSSFDRGRHFKLVGEAGRKVSDFLTPKIE
jgi:hypothetical protein